MKKIILFFLILTPFIALSQHKQKKFRHFTIEDGLSNNEIKCITQDKNGYLWIGTKDGLNKYDGYTFSQYTHKQNDSTSINGNVIFSLLVSRNGQLYVGSSNGINIYNAKKDNFVKCKLNDSIDNSLVINYLFEDSKNRLWIATRVGLHMKTNDNKKFTNFYHTETDKTSIASDYIFTVSEDVSKNIWIGTPKGISKYNEKKSGFTSYLIKLKTDNKPKFNKDITFIECKDANNLILGTQFNGLYIFSIETGLSRRIQSQTDKLSNNEFIYSIEKMYNNDFWICTFRNGISIMPNNSENIINIQHIETENKGLISNNIFAAHEDTQGNIWIATGEGLDLLKNRSKEFLHFESNRLNPNSLNNNNVKTIFKDSKKRLWIGTKGGGLNLYDNESGEYKHFKHNINNKSSIAGNDIFAIEEDSDNNLWIGTATGLSLVKDIDKDIDKGIDKDIDKGIFTNFYNVSNNLNTLSNNWILDITDNGDGKIWIATGVGLNLFDYKNNSLIHYNHENDHPKTSLLNDWVVCVYKDSQNTLWAGTALGISKLNDNNRTFTNYEYNHNDTTSLSAKLVQVIFEDSKNNLWFGTELGLNKFNRKNNTFTSYTVEDGIANDVINGILEDNNYNLWISTNNGISKFDPIKETFQNFDKFDGLQSNQFLSGSYFKDQNEIMYFGGINGYNSFNPINIADNTYIPKIIIAYFNKKTSNSPIENKQAITKHLNKKGIIELEYDDASFSIEFVAINFINSQKNRYKYILEGFDKSWINNGTNRVAHFTNIQPGKYTFKVKGSNNDGYWNEQGDMVQIIIHPPFWRTWWAYTAYFLLFILAMIIFRRYSIIGVKLKNRLVVEHLEREKTNQVNKMKLHFFTNISHEFRTPLTLIIGPLNKLLNSDINQKIKPQILLMHKNAEIMLRLVNQVMDFRKIEAGHLKLNISKVNIVDFVQNTFSAFTMLAEQKNIKFDFLCSEKEFELYFDKNKIERVLYNLLSNAFKFTTTGGEITVLVEIIEIPANTIKIKKKNEFKKCIEIKISDNGIGISKKNIKRVFERFYQIENPDKFVATGTGIGLSLVKSFINLHEGHISVQSELSKGTTFTILLQQGKEHFNSNNVIFTSEKITNDIEIQPSLKPTNIELEENIKEKGTGASVNKEKAIILIVEDNKDVREYIRSIFLEKFTIEEACDGEEGLLKATKILPDLIISDVMMPKMDGVKLCQSLKMNIKTSHIPIILLTAKTSAEYEMKGLESGADDYVAKPFNPNLLTLRVRNIIESRKKINSSFQKSFSIEANSEKYNKIDRKFLEKSIKIVLENMSEPDFSVEVFAGHVAMSRSNLFRKLKSLTGQTPVEFIRSQRLKKAQELLNSDKLTINDIAYEVGFQTVKYFRKCFKDQYGVKPDDYNPNINPLNSKIKKLKDT